MRLIDADELMESIRKALGIKSMTKSLLLPAERTIIDQIDSAPTVGGSVVGWISVKDRLPEKNGRYLCRYEQEVYGEVCRCTDFGMYDSNIGENGNWFVGKVTHWMPLPAKPKEESCETD